MVELALQRAQNNQTQAARLLDISRDALRYKMKKFGLIGGEEDKGAAPPKQESERGEASRSPHAQ
jgi:Zn-dependent peptidase ImmA (M78 family)